MKSALKKLGTLNATTILRSVFFSVIFLALYAFVLYVLINSPA